MLLFVVNFLDGFDSNNRIEFCKPLVPVVFVACYCFVHVSVGCDDGHDTDTPVLHGSK